MKLLLLLLTFFTFSLTSFAQKGRIEGKLTDSKTGNPIVGVSVLVKETGKGTSTNIDGRFVLNAEPGKKYTLTLSSVNYETKVVNEVETGANDIAYVDVILNPAVKMGEVVVVQASSAKKESTNAMINFQKNTNTV